MPVEILYTTKSRATGGRDGEAGTLDGYFKAPLTTPREFDGPGGEGVNPEQLFAAGYAACFLSAIRFVARQDKTVTAKLGISPIESG